MTATPGDANTARGWELHRFQTALGGGPTCRACGQWMCVHALANAAITAQKRRRDTAPPDGQP